MDIVEFLTRCLDEDEAGALAAAEEFGPDWIEIWSGTVDLSANREDRQPADTMFETHVATNDSRVSRFMVEHDPSRVLADIAAKRKLLANHQGAKTRSGRFTRDGRQIGEIVEGYASCGPCPGDGPCETQLLLAAPYADRPGFNPDWRIEA